MEKKTKVDQLKDMLKAKKEAEEKKSSVVSRQSSAILTTDDQRPTTESTKEQPSVQEQQVNADEMIAQIKAAEDEVKAHYDKLLRVMAEFENFKKRIDRERIEQARYSNQSLLHDLLPVLDDFDRVINHIPKETTPEITAIADGIKLIQNHFMTALSRHGLTPEDCEPGTAFDPNIHEAVAYIENEQPEGTILAAHRKGWKLHDRVIRAASVAVSKGKK